MASSSYRANQLFSLEMEWRIREYSELSDVRVQVGRERDRREPVKRQMVASNYSVEC